MIQKAKPTQCLLGDVDEKFLKKLIKQSVLNADPENAKIRLRSMTTREQKLSPLVIEAYEIALYVNFQPVLIKKFLKVVCKQLLTHQASVPCLKQIVTIISKAALTTTSLRTLERIFQSKELMDALKLNIIDTWWAPYSEANKPASNQNTTQLQKAASIGYGVWQGLASMFRSESDMEREMLVYRTTEMIQLWSDLTMMYQGDFKVLHDFYRLLR